MLILGLVLMISCVAVAVVGFMMALISRYSQDLPDVERLRSYQPSETTRIYAANGELIATLFKENRTWLPIEKIPLNFKHAVLATEDARFYHHQGVDLVGIARAAVTDYRSGGAAQGASTITMQLARNIFLHPRATLQRKIEEMLISIQLEKKFTKEEILELYLNQIYFGSGAYGIEAAAETYFNKKAADLTLGESAMIAGMPAAPSRYSPQVNFRLAKHRQILVLKRMVDCGYCTQKEALEAARQALKVAEPKQTATILKLPYFTTYVLHELFQKYDEDLLYRGGLRIYTTVDPKLQAYAEEAVKWGINTLNVGRNVHQSSLVAIEPKTGYIRAMVGGTGWTDANQFNRAWQTQRQPGSSFKLFVYSCAMENGYTPDSVVPDSPVTFRLGPTESWSPKNSDARFMGGINLKTALQWSRNVVSAKLVAALGPDKVIDLAYKFGVKSHIDPNLSIALGAVAVSPLEMATAFATMANHGVHIEPSGIKTIKDPDGNILEDNSFPYAQQVISPTTALMMTECLQNNVDAGTGAPAKLDNGRPAAGKTGTTDSHRDAWFCGFTPTLAAAVWCGNDDNSQMWHTFGGDTSAPIWKRFMERALKGKPVLHFFADAKGMIQVPMCLETHKRATNLCPDVQNVAYKWNAVPKAFCNIHTYNGTHNIFREKAGGDDHERPAEKPKTDNKNNAPGVEATPEEQATPGEQPTEVPTDHNGPPPDSAPPTPIDTQPDTQPMPPADQQPPAEAPPPPPPPSDNNNDTAPPPEVPKDPGNNNF
jgi:1A family penicillin-binding protein